MRPADRRLARLALPALGALVAEPVYVLTDTAIVGHLGTDQLAGLSVAAAVLLSAHSVFLFLAYGTTAAVSRHLGAGEVPAAAAKAVQGLWLAGCMGVLAAALGWVGAPAAIGVLGGDGAVAEHAEVYLRVSVLGLPALLVSLAGVGFLRGRQDTRTPLLVALATAVGNGLLEALLIFRFDQGIGASALSTVLAQTAGALVFVWQVTADARRLGAGLAPDVAVLVRLLAVGGHLVVRTLALRASLLVGVAVATRIGTADVAAYEIAFQLWSLAALALDALAIAAQSLVGHALGAGDADGARELGRRAMVLSMAAGVAIAVIVLPLREPLASLFSDDPRVEDLAAASLAAVALIQPINGLAFALDGILIGAGDQRYMAFAMTIPFAVYTAAALAVHWSGAGLGWLWAALSLFMVARWLVLHARFRTSRWVVLGGEGPAAGRLRSAPGPVT